MALSNIVHEPRREITESVIGVVVIGGWIWLDWIFVTRLLGASTAPDIALLMMLCGIAGPLALVMGLLLVHAVGEGICGWLADLGFDPRPRRRWH